MKKVIKIFNSITIAAIMLISGFCLIGLNQNKKTDSLCESAELPVYFSSLKGYYDEEENFVKIGEQIPENTTVLLNENEELHITLGDPNFNSEYALYTSPLSITVDNQVITAEDSWIKPNEVVTSLIGSQYYDINFNFKTDNLNPSKEGRYIITFSYIEYSGVDYSVSTFKTFSYTFFLFKESTYKSSSYPAVAVSNVETSIAGTSAIYGRTHQFNYNNPSVTRRLNLPTLTYNYLRFELEITKTVYNISSKTYVSLDENGNLTQTGDIVKIASDESLKQATITFNDIGNYQISYKFVDYIDGEKYYLDDLTSLSKYDRMNIFGNQLFYSDINSDDDQVKEFKLFDKNNALIAGKQTDITFTGFNESYIQADGTIANANDDISFSDFSLLPTTNQVPVTLVHNCTINKDLSYVYSYCYDDEQAKFIWKKTVENYDGSHFTDEGIYLVKITYTSSNALNPSKEYSQWFYFQIKNLDPTYTVKNEELKEVSSNSWTNSNVTVTLTSPQNPFNSDIKLFVSSKDYGQSEYATTVEVDNNGYVFTENKNYKVTIKFDKNLKKQYTSYFSIDKTEISGLNARSIEAYGNSYVKSNAVEFFSNSNICVEWNEKADKNNNTYAFYKYIPMVQTQTNWTTALLEAYYSQDKSIPVKYQMEYDPTNELTQIPYSNNIANTFVNTNNVLTENGMYIFYVFDDAGNSTYKAFVIDKTNPTVLQKLTDSNIYITDYASLNMVAENTTIIWGQYKVIEFPKISARNYNLETWEANDENNKLDLWLQQILKQNCPNSVMATDKNCNFKTLTINSNNNLYLASQIDTANIKIQINSDIYDLSNSTVRGGSLIDNYSYNVEVVKDGLLYEDTYSFYVNDESQISDDYSTVHDLQVSTDISKTTVRYNENGKFENLVKHPFEQSNTESSVKKMYYYPINWNVLQLQYLPTPTLNTIELDKVTIYYYPYVYDYVVYLGRSSSVAIENGEYYTLNEKLEYKGSDPNFINGELYEISQYLKEGILSYNDFVKGTGVILSKSAQEIAVYNYNSNINLGTVQADGLFVYPINTAYNSSDDTYYTKEGKYVVERTYRELGNTNEVIGSKYDFMTRNIAFFVDRQQIVSSPVSINLTLDETKDPDNILISQIGGSAYIEVLSGTENSKTFSQIYRANNSSQTSGTTYLLETNMLPVKIYLPVHKFGETFGEVFKTQNSLLFFENDCKSYINSNQMSITVENVTTGEKFTNNYSYKIESSVPNTTNYIKIGENYLVFDGLNENNMIELDQFSSVGVWKVTIAQNNSFLKGNFSSVSFNINIKVQAPDFEILDTAGNQLKYDSSYYWTNNNTLRVQWTDPSNEYMAKIDKTDIKCILGNKLVNPNEIITNANGLIHYFDLDVSSLSHGSEVKIIMHYEGSKDFYTPNSYEISKTVIIDKIAPTLSIDNLINNINEPSLINTVTLREGHNQEICYNKTISSGLFANFAYSVDKSNFENLIYNNKNNDFSNIYYRQVPNKYIDDSVAELNPSDLNALTQIIYSGKFTEIINITSDIDNFSENSYYEIAEVDRAGNITIYTIYYTNVAKYNSQNEDLDILSYTDKFDTYKVSSNELSSANYQAILTAKENFVLNSFDPYGYPWAVLTYGTDKYLFSPSKELANNQIYKITANGTEIVNLDNEMNFGIHSANYLLLFNNVPCTNITLSVAVTDKELFINYPTLENASFSIVPQQATGNVNVDWQYIEVWEYINAKVSKNALFEFGKNEPIDWATNDSYYLASYLIENNVTTFKINSPVKGAQYRYKVVDNFGTTYTFQHLYGEEFVNKIINHDGLVSPNVFEYDGNEHYLSNKEFTYNYYHSITKLTIKVLDYNNSTGTYTIYEFKDSDAEFETSNNYYNVSKYGAYTSVTLLPCDIEDDMYNGGVRRFILTASTEIDEDLSDEEIDYFMIYNLTPTINLKGKNRQDLNGLFTSGDNMTSDPVTIEFENDSHMAFPCIVEVVYPDGARTQITSGTTVDMAGDYQIIVSWPNELSVYNSKTYKFTISESAWQYYVVEIYDGTEWIEISPVNGFYSHSDNLTMYNTHYIVNTTNYKIRKNETQDIQVINHSTDTKNGISTNIYEITNYNSTEKYINYFRTTIAVTVIPYANKLVSEYYYTNTEGSRINFENSASSYIITEQFENSDSVIISWNSYYKIVENKIIAEVRFGEGNDIVNYTNISLSSNTCSIKLTRSGIYTFTFKDLAGNIHKFDYNTQIVNSSTSYEFTYVNNVIFTVNDQSPIQYAIYNSDVVIKIPNYTLSYYDSNAQPSIVVLRNGVEYKDYVTSTSERQWTFTEPGLYEITWLAKKDAETIRQEKYYFQIIRSNELIWAFNIENYNNYYIKQIIKNDFDVTKDFTDKKLGNTRIVNDTKYLTDLFISMYDELTGPGRYTITIATDNDLQQEFTYSFNINSAIPPISISVEEGTETTDEILVTFNAYNVYKEVGECIVRISGFKDITINEEYFASEHEELVEINLTSARVYFIQILTPSERLLFTYKVTRNQPLNAIAIILIVVSSLVVIGAIVTFVLLRKRMKIR